MTDNERILSKLDALDDKLDDTRETVVSISTRMEFCPTRDDVSQLIHTHELERHKPRKPAKIPWRGIGIAIGAILSALGISAATQL